MGPPRGLGAGDRRATPFAAPFSFRPSHPRASPPHGEERAGTPLRQLPSRTRAIGTLHDVLPPPARGRHSAVDAAMRCRASVSCWGASAPLSRARERCSAAEPFGALGPMRDGYGEHNTRGRVFPAVLGSCELGPWPGSGSWPPHKSLVVRARVSSSAGVVQLDRLGHARLRPRRRARRRWRSCSRGSSRRRPTRAACRGASGRGERCRSRRSARPSARRPRWRRCDGAARRGARGARADRGRRSRAGAVAGGAARRARGGAAARARPPRRRAGFYPTATHASAWRWDGGRSSIRRAGCAWRPTGRPATSRRSRGPSGPSRACRDARRRPRSRRRSPGSRCPLLLAHALLSARARGRAVRPPRRARRLGRRGGVDRRQRRALPGGRGAAAPRARGALPALALLALRRAALSCVAMTERDVTRITASWGAEGGGVGGARARRGGGRPVRARRASTSTGAAPPRRRPPRCCARGAPRSTRSSERSCVLEDDPSFNAGTGACLNADGLIELDASIMEGSRLRAGGVCALPPFPNPIAIARAVLDDGRHVLYAGEGAARFARARLRGSTAEAMTTGVARARWAAVGETGGRRLGGRHRRRRRARRARAVAAATSTGAA